MAQQRKGDFLSSTNGRSSNSSGPVLRPPLLRVGFRPGGRNPRSPKIISRWTWKRFKRFAFFRTRYQNSSHCKEASRWNNECANENLYYRLLDGVPSDIRILKSLQIGNGLFGNPASITPTPSSEPFTGALSLSKPHRK